MSLPIKDVLGVLVDNLTSRESVMPLSRSRATGWVKGLDIPMGGGTVIYTGHMYQLMPSIIAMEKFVSQFEDSWLRYFFGIGRTFNKAINLSWFMSRPRPQEQTIFNNIVRNIAFLLKVSGVQFGYLYDKELYSGTLLHDQGVCGVFEEHAHKVYERFRQLGVKHIITVDPHTTLMLRSVYPKIIEDYQLEVRSYLEVLAQQNMRPLKNLDREVVIHDSCVYSRFEGTIDEPRELLEKAGISYIEPEYSGKMTYCCGGPIESLFPSKAHSIAENRIEQLASRGSNIVTMCPICLINLKAAVGEKHLSVKDISDYLAEAYCNLEPF
jgi:hypothetical protein